MNKMEQVALESTLDRPLFEKERGLDTDRKMKFTLMKTFNRLGSDFASDETLDAVFDLGVACDLLIELSLYSNTDLKPEMIKQDFESFNRTGQPYTAQDFYKRIKNEACRAIIEVTFNVVAKARMLGLF
jgi:hypothetical protein